MSVAAPHALIGTCNANRHKANEPIKSYPSPYFRHSYSHQPHPPLRNMSLSERAQFQAEVAQVEQWWKVGSLPVLLARIALNRNVSRAHASRW